VNSSVTDRALLSIARMQSEMINAIDSINTAQKPLLVLSFENTVLQPQDAINKLEKFLGRQSTRRTKRVLKQQNLPRQQISVGKATSSYSFTSSKSSTEIEIYKKILSEIQASGSASAIAEFRTAVSTYNSRWPSQLNAFENLWA
jgi:predicted transcriptional regulator